MMDGVRRPFLDQVKRSEICAILAVGCTRKVAAHYVGCHPDTIRKTAAREPEFQEALEKAETRHEILHLSHINNAAKEGRYWRAAAWALERKYPERYGVRDPHLLTIEQLTDVLAQFADVVLEEIEGLDCHERILKRLSELTSSLELPPAEGAES